MKHFGSVVFGLVLCVLYTASYGQNFETLLKNFEKSKQEGITPYRYVVHSYQTTHFLKNDSTVASTPENLKVFVNQEGVLLERGHLLMWYDKEKNVIVDNNTKTILVQKQQTVKEHVELDNSLLDTLSKNSDKVKVSLVDSLVQTYSYTTTSQGYPLEITLLHRKGDLFFEKTTLKHYFKDFLYTLVQETKEFSSCPTCVQYNSHYFVEFISGAYQPSSRFKGFNLLFYATIK
jgi:hypothetical protein